MRCKNVAPSEEEIRKELVPQYQSYNKRLSPHFFGGPRRLPRRERLHDVALPLARGPQSTGVRPVQDGPHFLVRVLDRCAGEPEPILAGKLVVCEGNLR